jgi:hypothetical protein
MATSTASSRPSSAAAPPTRRSNAGRMLLAMSAMSGRTPDQRRRSFLVLVLVLIVAAAAVAFLLSRGGDEGSDATASSPGGSGAAEANLQTACREVPPDQAFRVDALRRTADRIRADVATMQEQGIDADAAKATTVAEALERLADAEASQQGVSKATKQLGQTLASIC